MADKDKEKQAKAEAEAKAKAGGLDPKWLKGLKFSTSEKRKTDDGEKYIPISRELTAGDVLSWKEKDGEVVIVAADGKKHRVEK